VRAAEKLFATETNINKNEIIYDTFVPEIDEINIMDEAFCSFFFLTSN